MSNYADDDALWCRLRRVFRLPATRARLDQEVDEELRFHIEGRIEEIVASHGLSRADAEREAYRRFGDFDRYRREAGSAHLATHHRRQRMELRDAILRETSRAARSLRRSPGFAAITVVTLALGIGAATAIFTLLDAVVLRPLPYADADRLVELSSPVPRMKGQTRWGLARHEMFYFLDRGHTLENLGVYNTSQVTVIGEGAEARSGRARWARTSASLLNVLGFVPASGRLLLPADNHDRVPAVVVISDGYWRRHFAGDANVVGRTLNVEGVPLTVVGVLPPGADLPDARVDLWVPAWVDSTTNFNNHTWSAIGRLRPGFSAADAERELAPLTAALPEAYPQVYGPNFITNTGFTTEVRPLRDTVVGDMVTRALWALFGAVALVLLIAGANVANLFLVRIDARRRDVAVRTALGADRRHLAVQYLTESLLLTIVAGAVAIGLARAMLALLLTLAPSELPRLSDVHLDAASLAFAAGLSLLTGVVFGLVPLAAARLDLAMLRDGGRGLTTSPRRMRARRLLVTAQMAFAVVLLAAATLMLRTVQNLRAVRPGFDPRGVLVMELALPGSRYGSDAVLASRFHEQLAARVKALPGVLVAGVTDRMPLVSGDWCTGITIQGPTPDAARGTCPPSTLVSPGYFEAMGIRVEGRSLTWDGMNAGDGAVVVSRAFAQQQWPDENPIGKGLKYNGSRDPWYRVVGVAEDVRGTGLTAPPTQNVYFPIRPIPDAPLWGAATDVHFVVRTSGVPGASLANAVTRIAGELEPQVAVTSVRTMEAVLSRSIARQSFTMVLLMIAGGIALLLSAVGIYGVISFIVNQRRGEIGVRMALGARTSQVAAMVLRQSLGLALVGVVVGVAVALATTRVLQALLFGVAPTDATSLLVTPLILLLVAGAASVVPARRASRVDPAEALRSE